MTPHSSTCMPPKEPPTTASQRGMPRWSATAAWLRTMSRIDTTGKSGAVGPAGRGVHRRRAGRALAAAEHVHTDDEVAVGVERPAGTDHGVPPPRGRVAGRGAAGDVAVPGDGVADEHGVGPRGIQLAPGLVGDGDAAELAAALEDERATVGQGEELPVAHGVTGAPRAGDRQLTAPVAHVAPPSSLGGRTLRYVERDDFVASCEATSPPRRVAPWVSAPGCRTRSPGSLLMSLGRRGYPRPGSYRKRSSVS